MLNVTFTVQGDVIVSRVLSGIEERTRNLAPAWPAVVKVFQQIVAKAFDTEGASTGAKWPALAASTQRDRARHGYGAAHPILKRTGTLERALTIGQGAFASMTPTSLRYILGADADHFKFHQSKAPRRFLPRRAPVLLTADDRRDMLQPVRLWITGRDPNGQQRDTVR